MKRRWLTVTHPTEVWVERSARILLPGDRIQVKPAPPKYRLTPKGKRLADKLAKKVTHG